MLNPFLFIVDVMSFGARGNDSSFDDAPFFQAAIDFCYAAGGGIVLVPNRVFFFRQPIFLKKGVSLIGTGAKFPDNAGSMINIYSYPTTKFGGQS